MRAPSNVRDFALAAVLVAAVAAIQAAGPVVPGSHAYGAGANAMGELGDGTTVAKSSPTAVAGNVSFTMIDGGSQSSIGIDVNGDVYTWGRNSSLQLGYASTGEHRPRLVPGDHRGSVVSASIAGDHAVIAVQDGSVVTWGNNTQGQLGRNGTAAPATVPALANITQVSAGHAFTLARDSSGNVYGWGINNSSQLGIAGTAATPRQITGLPPIQAVAAGGLHALALADDGTVWAWGANHLLQAGQAEGNTVAAPAMVAGLSGVVAIAAGFGQSLALKSDGTVWAWGRGPELGARLPAMATSAQPVQVLFDDGGVDVPLTGVISIAAGGGFAIALRGDGRWVGWGFNGVGQLGLGTTTQQYDVATLAPAAPTPILRIGAGESHAFMLAPGTVITGSFTAPETTTCSGNVSATLALDGYSLTGVGKADVMLVLDESGSTSAAEFTSLKTFAKNFVNALDIGPSATRVGVVMFSTDARLILAPSDDRATIIAAITGVVQAAGFTCIGCGLNEADATLDGNARSGASRFVVVVTDGINNRSDTASNPAAHLAAAITNAQADNTVISVGIGTGVDVDELEDIASDISGVETAFLTPDFNSLDQLITNLTASITTPGATTVTVELDFGSAWHPLAATSTSPGSAVAILLDRVAWTLPAIDHAGAQLALTLKPARGGIVSGFVSVTYQDAEGQFAVISNATVSVSGCAAVIRLTPESSSGPVGTPHTVKAQLLDDFNNPISGVQLRFDVMSGPAFGALGTVSTNASGEATKSYVSPNVGTDVIEASLASDATFRSNSVTREWVPPNTPPTARAGADQTVDLEGSPQIDVTLDGSATTDDGRRQPLTYSWTSNTGVSAAGVSASVTLGRGTHVFTLSVFDGDHTRTDTVNIMVTDPSAPAVTADVAGTPGTAGWYISDVSVSWTLSDPESGISSSTGCAPTAITTDTAEQTLTCTAVNGAGAESTVPITVKRDARPPTIAAMPDIESIATSANGSHVSFMVPVSDATSGLQTEQAFCTPPAGSEFPLGSTVVICTIADRAGHESTTSFEVSVADPTPPDIVPQASGPEGTPGWHLGEVTLTWDVLDPQTGIASSSGCGPVTISGDTPGVEVSCTATNGAGASTTITKTIRLDATPPAISTPADMTAEATGPSGAAVGYPAATATDATSGLSGIVSCAPPSGHTFQVGETSVLCSAADVAGNSASKNFTITVADATPPTIEPLANIEVIGTEAVGKAVSWSVDATDSVSSVSVSCSPAAGSTFPYGSTPVLCTATDAAGNSATAGFAVIVSDVSPPEIAAAVSGTVGGGGWYTSAVQVSWTVTDPQTPATGCDATTIAFDTAGQAVTCTATSAGGSASQSVTIKRDATGPVLTTSGPLSAEATSASGAVVNYAAASATDALSGPAGAPSCAPLSGSLFPLGANIVTCTGADVAGNISSASFTITVSEQGEPGRMHGAGQVTAGADKVVFNFSVVESASGAEQGRVDVKVKQGKKADDRFEAKSVTNVRFSALGTVVFSGAGTWDRQSGYTYVATASDRGEPGKNDTFTIEVRASNGSVIFNGGGTLAAGNVKSMKK
jgi:alpha-tubulin suppressor-like RCC1 family protein/uncharacterized protein YegL